MVSAEIISIGNELLSGLTINSNAAFIGLQLANIGVRVRRIITIPDTPQEIQHALQSIHQETGIIIVTGGLGPTPDDLTKKSIAEFFNRPLILHEATLGWIKKLFEGRGMKMPDINRDQAMIPQGAHVLANKFGTAPGLEIEFENKVFYFLPGVPYEMKALISDQVVPAIRKRYEPIGPDVHVVRTNGLAESKLFEMAGDILRQMEANHNIAFLPKSSGVDLRLQAAPGKKVSSEYLQQLRSVLKDHIYSETGQSLPQVIGDLLTEKQYTLSIAESFTGGTLADWISHVPGCSDYFMGSVTTYSNQSKQSMLAVPKHIIQEHGAVSAETVAYMVRGVQKLFATDCAIASTGIAGPGGATPGKPVGLSYLAAMVGEKTQIKKFNFGKDRRINKERGAAAGLDLLRRMLLE